jgi:hypothetical protein
MSAALVTLRRYVSLLNDPRPGARGHRASEHEAVRINSGGWYHTGRMNGKFRNWPMNGSWRRKVMMTGKKSLKKNQKKPRRGYQIMYGDAS